MDLISENPIESIWETLSRWQSVELAKKLIREKAEKEKLAIADELLEKKAIALSACIRNAKENILAQSVSLTVGSTLNYYGCMWLSAALLVSDPENEVQLDLIESFTSKGHGLKNIADTNGVFPDNEFVYVLQQGFFVKFLKLYLGMSQDTVNGVSLPKSLNEFPTEDSVLHRLVPIRELFARIHQLADTYQYVFSEISLSFELVCMAPGPVPEHGPDAIAQYDYDYQPFPIRDREGSWIELKIPTSAPEERIRECRLPLQDLQIRSAPGSAEAWCGKLAHEIGTYWYEHISLNKIGNDHHIWISPLLGQDMDPLAVHLMLLYQLSILARYRPAIWRRILEGDLDQYKIIIEAYNRIFVRVVPQMVLEQLVGEPVYARIPALWS